MPLIGVPTATSDCIATLQGCLQGRDTSKIAGLSCRSGRVVLAGDKNYNPVPITMILKEHEDEVRGTAACCVVCICPHYAHLLQCISC